MAKPAFGYERSDVEERSVFLFGAALAVSLLAIGLGVWLWLHWLDRSVPAARTLRQSDFAQGPGPRLQADPARDLARLQARDEAALKSYGWIDRRSGVIQIPIERAMDLTAAKGEFR